MSKPLMLSGNDLSRRGRLALHVLSAGGVALAFPRTSFYALAFVALAPALYVCHGSRARPFEAFRAGFTVGFIAHLGILWWIARLYATEITYPGLRIPILILLAAFEALFYGVAFWGWNRLSHGRWWVWPGFWVATEYARSLTSLAFPWTVLANTLGPQPLLLQPAALGGIWLLDLGLATVNLLVFMACSRPRWVLAAAALCACWLGSGRAAMGSEEGSLRVAIVQPNALPEFKWHEGGRSRVLRDLEDLTDAAVDSLGVEGERLLVWPETALPFVVKPGGGAEFWLSRLVDDLGIPLLTGALGTKVVGGEEFFTNAAVAVVPGKGVAARYDKLHLVPFSEKMPFSDVFPAIKRLNFGQGDYARGGQVVLLPVDCVSAGVVICFEAILPGLVRRHVREGAEFLVNITNDSWFGNTGACEQHAFISLIRAVEHRRWMVRAANTGLSMIVDPWGRVVRRGGLFRPEVIAGTVKPRTDRSAYARVGDWAAWLGLIAALWIVAEEIRRCRAR